MAPFQEWNVRFPTFATNHVIHYISFIEYIVGPFFKFRHSKSKVEGIAPFFVKVELVPNSGYLLWSAIRSVSALNRIH